jgi:hypothetical protein
MFLFCSNFFFLSCLLCSLILFFFFWTINLEILFSIHRWWPLAKLKVRIGSCDFAYSVESSNWLLHLDPSSFRGVLIEYRDFQIYFLFHSDMAFFFFFFFFF